MDLQIVTRFLEQTYTKTQALRRLRILKDLIDQNLFRQNSKASQILDSDPDLVYIKGLGPSFYSQISPSQASIQLKQIEDYIKIDQNITLYLAFELPQAEIENIGRWIKSSLGPNALFEPSYDPSLIGGCAISYKGIYKDYSLRAKIKENHQKILEVLGSFRK